MNQPRHPSRPLRRARSVFVPVMAALLLVCLGLLPASRPASAQGARDALYSAATPVPDQSAQARQAAFSRDLAQVFVKVSGNPDVAQVSALAPVLDKAGDLVVEYRYRTRSEADGGGQVLWAHFDPKAVDRALSRAGQGTWGQGRPTVIAWVLNADSILSDNPNDPIVAAMRKSADDRGLPLVIPLMDLTDQKQVSGFDIRTLYLPDLQKASARYDARAMLVGDIQAADVGVASQWTLVFGHSTAPYQLTAASPQAAGAQAVARAATLLARQLAYVGGTGGSGRVRVVVEGVHSLSDLDQVEQQFAGVPGVTTTVLAAVRGEVVRFSVEYAGTPNDLAQALTVSGTFAQAVRPSTALAPAAATGLGLPVPELDLRYTP